MTLLLLLVAATIVPVRHPPLEGLQPSVAAVLARTHEALASAQAARSATAESYGEAGRVYHAYEFLTAAEDCYRNAALQAPADFRWAYLLAVVLEEQSRPQDAVTALERALAGPDKYLPALLRLTSLHLLSGKIEDARRVLAPALVQASTQAAVLAQDGELSLAEGHPRAAETALRAALAREPRANRLRYPLGMALRAQGRKEEAAAELAQAGRVGVRAADPLLDAVAALRKGEVPQMMDGHRAFQAGDFRAAAEAFARAVAASGGSAPGPLVNLAAAEERLGETSAALVHLRQAYERAPDNVTVLFNLGTLLARTGHASEALPILRDLVSRSPEDAEARAALEACRRDAVTP